MLQSYLEEIFTQPTENTPVPASALLRLSRPMLRGLMSNALYLSRLIPALLLHTIALFELGSKKTDNKTKIYIGFTFALMSAGIGIMLFSTLTSNIAERNYLKKIQAILNKPRLLTLIQKALEENLTILDSETFAPDITLTDKEKEEAQFGLDFLNSWDRSSNELAQVLPRLFQLASGSQLIPQPFADAMGRLLFQANIPVFKQIEDKIAMHEIDRTYGKGGSYYLSTSIDQKGLNLTTLLDLARANHINNISLETLTLHSDSEYEDALVALADHPNAVKFEQFKKAFLKTVERTLLHDQVQTVLKLGLGAFGWQLAYRLYLGNLNETYNPELADLPTNKIALWAGLWISTGVGAAIALNLGILISQDILSRYNGGINANRFHTLCGQLFFSVIAVDSLWQPFTDLSMLYLSVLQTIHPLLADIAKPIVLFIAYMSMSFFFKELHNWTNRAHTENSGQKIFTCNNEFVGILTAAYFGFNVIVGLTTSQLDLTTFTFTNVLIDCVLAGLCTALLPALLISGQNYKKMQTLTKDMTDRVVIQKASANTDIDIEEASAEAATNGIRQRSIGTGTNTLSDDLTTPLLETSPNSDTQENNMQISNSSLLTRGATFGLKTLATASEYYDELIQGASYLYP